MKALHDFNGFKPRLIAWEITRSCPLKCQHCRASSCSEMDPAEMTTAEIFAVLDNIADHYDPIIILTGGEPTLRQDLIEIVHYATERGLRTVMATCGTSMTVKKALQLKDAGIARLSLSLDGSDPESHDAFRGVSGSFETVLSAISAIREAGLSFQINMTVTRSNSSSIESVLDLATQMGASAFHPFLLVPVGRGEQLRHEILDPQEYEALLTRIFALSQGSSITLKPTCAPQYHRILHTSSKSTKVNNASGHHGLDTMTRGCLGGTGFAFISHVGRIQACGFLEMEAGDLREADYRFDHIWEHSALFKELRDFDSYAGACGKCDHRNLCGGCRARAFALSGDHLAEDPGCVIAAASHPLDT